MKKITTISLAFISAIFFSCNKEQDVLTRESEKEHIEEEVIAPVTVKVTTEFAEDSSTKVTIEETGSKFNLNWEGTESFVVANSNNTNASKGANTFTVSSYSGIEAEFTGTLPDAGSGTVNYIGAFNFVSSTDSYVRAEIPATQTYSPGGAVATNCLLVARADNCSVGTLGTLNFKTMNSFMKFSLKKGSAATGSSNDYTKMYVQSIKIETVQDGEAIAGRFGFRKEGDWGTAYDETVTSEKKSLITLNCVTGTYTDGVELSDSDTDFYISVAFGTYTKGLKVTITVKNQGGDYGTYERTISKNSSYVISRNQLIAMPSLTVNPDDVSVETYTLINRVANLTAGDYIMCALKDDIYRAFIGTFKSSQCNTEDVSYNPSTKILDYTDAVVVTLTSTGTANQYKISWTDGVTTKYLKSTSATNLAFDTDAANAEAWTVSNTDTGLFLTGATNSGVIKSAATASSRYIRSYASTNTATTGIYFFKKD